MAKAPAKPKVAAKPAAKAPAKAAAKPQTVAKAAAKPKTVAKAPAKAAAKPKTAAKTAAKPKTAAKSKSAAPTRNPTRFNAPLSQDFTISDNSGVVGHVRIKPNAVAWKPKRAKAYQQISLEQLASFAAEHGRSVSN